MGALRHKRPSGMPDVTPLLVRLVSQCRALSVEERAGGVAFRLAGSTGRVDYSITCLLGDPRVPGLAERWGTTRSAAAVSLWAEHLENAVVAIGNAPTALFHLLEMLDAGAPRPAAIVGVPVGFIGAAESKEALIEHELQIPFLAVRGRRGGSAMASSALNALAQEQE